MRGGPSSRYWCSWSMPEPSRSAASATPHRDAPPRRQCPASSAQPHPPTHDRARCVPSSAPRFFALARGKSSSRHPAPTTLRRPVATVGAEENGAGGGFSTRHVVGEHTRPAFVSTHATGTHNDTCGRVKIVHRIPLRVRRGPEAPKRQNTTTFSPQARSPERR